MLKKIVLVLGLCVIALAQPNKAMPPVMAGVPAETKTNWMVGDVDYWKDSTFHQASVDLKGYAKGVIRAQVDGKWQDFKVIELPKAFMDWSFAGRKHYIEILRKADAMPPLSGPHNGMVASHGMRRKDSQYAINNAVKGMGYIPVKAKLPEMLALLKKTWNDSMPRKLEILDSLYTNCQDNYDKTKLVSLELYSRPGFETHSFLNQMTDPGVAIVFLDMPSYEVRAITQLLHPKDKQLSTDDLQVVEWCNTVHDYFHGDMGRKSIAVIYHVTEVFDNSPGRGGKGKRIMPLLGP
jgi:hypothetical protein